MPLSTHDSERLYDIKRGINELNENMKRTNRLIEELIKAINNKIR